MTTNQTAQKAITDAWDFWLSQHDITVPDRIETAVRTAVSDWLDDHPDVVSSAITDAMTRWLTDQPGPTAPEDPS